MTKQGDALLKSKRARALAWFLGTVGVEVLTSLLQASKSDARELKNPMTWLFAALSVAIVVRATFGDSPVEIEPIEIEGVTDRKPKR